MPTFFAPLTVPNHPEPRVSVVICAYGHIDMTYHCLYSIALAADPVDIEVIVVNDASPDDSEAALWCVEGIKLITNPVNQGYLRSVNVGLAAARGDYVMLLNNDTAVHPGWLSSLVARADSDPEIGAVGSLLLNPDGSVQEAGAIIWSDGTGWNYGQGLDADDRRFAMSRNVDYCSAAALLVRAPFFRERGGFDERFAPAFYEDTDLCFALHEAGQRVVFEPASVVTHVGGASYGTDLAGPKAGQEHNRVLFSAKWKSALSGQMPMNADHVEAARDYHARRLLICDLHLPDVTRDSGSVRMMAIIEAMIEAGWLVHFWNMDGIMTESLTAKLTELGVGLFDPSRGADAQIRSIGRNLELFWVSRPTVAVTVMMHLAELVPHAPIIYDTVDLHFIREQRRLALLPNEQEAKAQRVSKAFELAAVQAADVTIAISDDEANILRAEVPQAQVLTMGNVHEVPTQVPGLARRSGIVFVGGWEHLPNADAATLIAQKIMPRLRPLEPGVGLKLVGSHVTTALRELAADDIEILGWVPDVAPILDRARVFCAPLFWGAGVKGKIGQSLAHGLPVVTTTIGAEGMGLEHGVNVLIADSLDELVSATALLLDDDALWEKLSRNGRAHIAARFGPATARAGLEAVTSLATVG